jgi:hypothetical protein
MRASALVGRRLPRPGLGGEGGAAGGLLTAEENSGRIEVRARMNLIMKSRTKTRLNRLVLLGTLLGGLVARVLVTASEGASSGAIATETQAAQDMEFLRALTRDVVAASRVQPGRKAGGSPTNACGFTLIMPGGRGSYPAFWIRDFAMSLESGFVTAQEMLNHLRLTARAQNGPAARQLKHGLIVPPHAIPDHINFDGGAVFYPGTYASGDDQGTGAYGILPPVDDHYEFVHIAWCLFRTTGRTDFLLEPIDGVPLLERLAAAFAAPRTEPQTGLVVTDAAQRAVGFGFCDAIYFTGQMLFPSLLRYRAAGQLAGLHQALEQPERASHYREIQQRIAGSLLPVFGDPARLQGWLMAATQVGRQPDVWGTAYALHLGAITGTAAQRAADTLSDAARRQTIVFQAAVRHVPTDFDASPTSAWERTAGVTLNTYQNGAYWHTPTGWLIEAVRRREPKLASQLFNDYIQHLRRGDFRLGPGHEAPWECFNPKGYAQNGIYMTSVTLPCAVLATPATPAPKPAPASHSLENAGYRLTIGLADGQVTALLEDKLAGFRPADGPCLYRAEQLSGNVGLVHPRLEHPSITVNDDTLTIRGELAGLRLEQIFVLPRTRPIMEERIVLRNLTNSLISLSAFEAGFARRVTDSSGQVLGELARDRWIAVPLRARATDPKGHLNDFSIRDLLTKPGYEPRVNKDQAYSQVPSRHRHSEGWAWTHGDATLGLFAFSQENMLFSVVSAVPEAGGSSLRFGGACMISGEPAALTRIGPGQAVDLGVLRYQTTQGGYAEASYAYRSMLDEKGCRFPKDYNPPVHWEQLYDMPEAWTDRPRRYTRAIVEQEAQKGRDYSCEALYLDPGWDTDFGTFLWGERWLGPRRQFIQEMKSKYDLAVSLHCPLATWMSHQYSWGLGAVKTWPEAATRLAPEKTEDRVARLLVPALREGRRNLALLPGAKPNASSVFAKGANPLHQVAHLNDGWFGNSASWITDKMPAWAEVDLGAVHAIGQVRVGNDHAQQYTDRAATELRVLVATNYSPESGGPGWRTVAQSKGQALQIEKVFSLEPCLARWVRVELLQAGPDQPRLDEIEIYEADPVSEQEAQAFAQSARRGPKPQPAGQMLGPLLCLGSKQYLDEAEKRLLANCADGAVFLMYDGNWWNGGCLSTHHGHPVPYRYEDHTRANLDLAQRVHAQYPKVLIEMHDPIAGGSAARITPVYYKYGLPGSYDENWGFELMWDPLADLKEGRIRSLYYYNLGCNVPIYLHINLNKDNESCVVLWWYASTCRHLGIGGTSPKAAVVAAQKQAMKRYRQLDRFYKRGEFFGISEEIHLHVLPTENAFVVNAFNLSDQPRVIAGEINLARLGLDLKRSYASADGLGTVRDGRYRVSLELPPWSARVAHFQPGVGGTGAALQPPREGAPASGVAPSEQAAPAEQEQARWSQVRGFNYQPSFGRTGLDIWIDRFDGAAVERELGLGRQHFPGMNTVRLWLAHDAYFKDPAQFARNFETVLNACQRHRLRALPTLFNNWHSVPDFGGISSEMINYWFASFGRNGQASNYVFRPYLEALFKRHAADPRVLAWDLCNEPFNNGREVYLGWLRHTYQTAKALGARQPVGVSVAASLDDLRLVEPFSDVLMIHPYFAPQVPWPALRTFAREKGKALLATECCWGALDDARRVALVEADLGTLQKQGIGFLAHALHESPVADLHRPQYGIISSAEYMAFIHMDGSLRAGHHVFNRYATAP